MNMISYSELTHLYFFLTWFIEGLRADIRAMVLIQRPPDLDTSCSLALLQEEVTDGEATMRATFNQMPFLRSVPTSTAPSAVAFPRPTAPIVTAEDRRGTDAARPPSDGSKIATLHNFRRTRGLCFKCGERWGKDHTCPATVQIHFVEELLKLIGPDEESLGDKQADHTCPATICLCCLSMQ